MIKQKLLDIKSGKLKAVDNNTNQEILMLDNLPNASFHQIKRDSNTGPYYSEIYVYI